MSAFVDSSAWYAAADRGDSSHQRATKALGEEEPPLVTSDHVLVETWMLLRHRLGLDAAERFWSALRSGVAALEPVRTADLESAWNIGEVYADQGFSLVDRTSFAVMQRLGLERAVSYDDDFVVYRYGPGRRRALTVVR